jgi:hypothetical protein
MNRSCVGGLSEYVCLCLAEGFVRPARIAAPSLRGGRAPFSDPPLARLGQTQKFSATVHLIMAAMTQKFRNS